MKDVPINPSLAWSLGDSNVEFRFKGVRAPRMPFGEADLSLIPPEAVPSLQHLQELWAREFLEEVSPGRWRLPFDRIHELEEDERNALRLSPEAGLEGTVKVQGVPGREQFRVTTGVEHPSLGRMAVDIPRVGPFFVPAGRAPILVPHPLIRLLEICEAGPGGESAEDHLVFLSQVKRLGEAAGARLDPFLETEHYFFPSQTQLEIEEKSPEEIEIRPTIETAGGPTVGSGRLRSPAPPRVTMYLGPGRRRERVVLSPEVREQIRAINRKRCFTGSEVPRFLENPEAFLPLGIDLDDFSKRVKGLRTVVYNSRPYVHIRRSDGGWFEGIPGVTLEPTTTGENENVGETAARQIKIDDYRHIVKKAQESGEEFVPWKDGWVRIDRDKSSRIIDAIDGLGDPDVTGKIRIPQRAILDIYENLDSLEFDLPPAEELGLHLNLGEFPDPCLPESFVGQLKHHQAVGFRWLAYLDEKETGGLLADDMGLGKTVQVIVHIAKLAEEGRLRPSLVVCPKTLMDNWCQEIGRFFPNHGKLGTLEGGHASAEQLRECDIVVTSYDQLRRQQLELAKVDWKLIASDEAQFAKNPTAQRTTALKALKSKHRVALTGTPVENGLIEFWCIMDFVRPGLLSSWQDFRTNYERPLANAETEQERGPLVQDLMLSMGRHYLRRMKSEVLKDLPPKKDVLLMATLSEEQWRLYHAIARRAVSGGRGEALAAITKLLMISAHPQALDFAEYRYREEECPKLDATLTELARIRDLGEKAVLFTRFKNLQYILRSAIAQKFDLWVDVINGDITHNRQQLIDRFSREPGFNVLILSHQVGGVGLNITAANHVFHYTRPWNPAQENQATDRVHRIGQGKPVFVYRPIVKDSRFKTVEERLDSLLATKSQLARDVLRPSKEMDVRGEDLLTCLDEAAEQNP